MTKDEALKQARSVISSINQSKHHRLTMNDENVFWQREEWVRWALDEVLPLIEEALAQPEKDIPKIGCVNHDCDKCKSQPEQRSVSEQQEPVAKPKLIGWRTENFLWETDDIKKAQNWEPNIGVLPIFEGDPNTQLTTPPQRKPLTREKIDEMADDCAFLGNIYEITRAIEAAHNIKE